MNKKGFFGYGRCPHCEAFLKEKDLVKNVCWSCKGEIKQKENINNDFIDKNIKIDYSLINSWSIFSENFEQIKKDHSQNISDDEKRISIIKVLLKSEPKVDMFSGKEDSFENMNRYLLMYKKIMKTYIINNMVMMNDIRETEHFKSLDQKNKKLFVDFHKYLGNELLQNM